jgi:hypothetical protein
LTPIVFLCQTLTQQTSHISRTLPPHTPKQIIAKLWGANQDKSLGASNVKDYNRYGPK